MKDTREEKRDERVEQHSKGKRKEDKDRRNLSKTQECEKKQFRESRENVLESEKECAGQEWLWGKE